MDLFKALNRAFGDRWVYHRPGQQLCRAARFSIGEKGSVQGQEFSGRGDITPLSALVMGAYPGWR